MLISLLALIALTRQDLPGRRLPFLSGPYDENSRVYGYDQPLANGQAPKLPELNGWRPGSLSNDGRLLTNWGSKVLQVYDLKEQKTRYYEYVVYLPAPGSSGVVLTESQVGHFDYNIGTGYHEGQVLAEFGDTYLIATYLHYGNKRVVLSEVKPRRRGLNSNTILRKFGRRRRATAAGSRFRSGLKSRSVVSLNGRAW